jgi:RimJ/RimL family protein N-acetyltransferase
MPENSGLEREPPFPAACPPRMKNPSVRALNYPQRVASERLELRWPVEADARELFERCTSDPVVTRYLLWPAHNSIDQTLAFINTPVSDTGVEFQSWLMRTKESGQIVGVIGCRRIEPHIIQFGYYLAQSEWGRGYATEATRAMLPLWLSHPEIFRVQAFCDLENAPSARVLTKAGLKLEGTLGRYIFSPNLGPEPRDGYLYAATKGDAATSALTRPA